MSQDLIRVQRKYLVDPITPVVQCTDYYCGPSVAQMVLAKYGIDRTQNYLAGVMRTNQDGTEIAQLTKTLQSYKLRAIHYQTRQIDTLIQDVHQGKSVILDIDAYQGSSHYVLLIGESRRNWFFADPMIHHGLGFIRKFEFSHYWRYQNSIVVWKPRRGQSSTIPVWRIPR